MSLDKYQQIQENMKIKNKLQSIGIGCSIVGPKGEKGDIGPTGPIGPAGPTGPSGSIPVSSTEELFFTSYEDTNKSNEMLFKDSWLIPNHSISFTLVSDSEVEVQPGIYEIAFSGLIEKADSTHGAGFYLQDKDGAAIKDFSYELPIGSGNQMHFSSDVIFRFEHPTVLKVTTNFLGDEGTSNVLISSVNLLMKKIHEYEVIK